MSASLFSLAGIDASSEGRLPSNIGLKTGEVLHDFGSKYWDGRWIDCSRQYS